MKKLLLVLAAACAGCNSGGAQKGVTAIHDLHLPPTIANPPTLTADFYMLPFPNDLRMDADGTVALGSYPRLDGLLAQYVDLFDTQLRGFGTNSGVYFRFDGAIDPASLPADANASLDAAASAFLVDVTPSSPTFGKRSPLTAKYTKDSFQFIGPFWVALLPFPGIPLREKTTYAAVLTDGLRAADGGPVRRHKDLDAALQNNSPGDGKVAAAVTGYAPFTKWLASQPGLAAHVVNATVFTTLDATSTMPRLRKAVYDQAPAPVVAGLTAKESGATWQVFEGSYMSPNFQTGLPPYGTPGDGDIRFDSAGVPMMQRLESLRFALTVPTGTMPAAGWPIVLYAHGTCGSYRSFIDDASGPTASSITAADGTVLSRMAMISIDQVLHPPRDPSMPSCPQIELNFYNFQNPIAGLGNVKQGALDDFQLLRLVKSIDIAAAPMTGQPIKFDPSRIYFKGHSQGGTTGPLFLAAEPEVKAAVLSGAGAVIILALLNKTKPVNIPQVVNALFQDPVDQFHPMLSLVQNFLETSDPANYARQFFREPPAGFAPKSIFQSIGLVDTYAPVPTLKALALAMGVQPVQPMLEPIDGLTFAGQSWAPAPQQLNVDGGMATGVVLEYLQKGSNDGHFVIFDVAAANHQSNRFLATHAATGTARLDPP